MTRADSPEPEPSGPTREDLEREILGAGPSLTADDVVAATGSTIDHGRRLWRALGFPAVDEGEAAFTTADRDAMTLLLSTVESGRLDFETAVKLVRAIGHTMARLADWQVATLSEYVEGLERAGRGTGSRLTTGLDMIRDVEPPFAQIMVYAWRRHVAAAVGRVEALGAQDSDLHTMTVTSGFADLVSFTELSNGIDEDSLASLVEDFESLCADIIAARAGRLIKTLGDSVLFIAEEPRTAVDIACDIVERIGADDQLPDVHVGLATGPVVLRLGDVFGPPVNMASRLTAVARRNRVICDAATCEAMQDEEGYVVRRLTQRSIRGFGVVEPISIRRL